MMSITISVIALLLSVMLIRVLRRWRGRHESFDLGTVSQQWLLVHNGKDR
jgi:hypothetical protein